MTRAMTRFNVPKEIARLRRQLDYSGSISSHAGLKLRLMLAQRDARLVAQFLDDLPDAIFHTAISGLSFRADRLPLSREVALYRRIVRTGGFTSRQLPHRAVLPAAQAGDPALFEACLRKGFNDDLGAAMAVHLAQAAESIFDPGCARLLARWIFDNPEAFSMGCRRESGRLVNNPKPALALLATPSIDQDPEIIAPIHTILRGRDPAAFLFGASRHQVLARRMFQDSVTPEAVLEMRLRDIRRLCTNKIIA